MGFTSYKTEEKDNVRCIFFTNKVVCLVYRLNIKKYIIFKLWKNNFKKIRVNLNIKKYSMLNFTLCLVIIISKFKN